MEMGKIGVGAEHERLRAFPLTNGIVRLAIDFVNNNNNMAAGILRRLRTLTLVRR